MRFAILLFAAVPLFAQTSPYASMQQRAIKALSEDSIREYREGAGMGLALAAELNGYPGPKHILELADKLRLTEAQTKAVKQVFDRMHEDAVKLGSDIVELEASLDRAFRDTNIKPEQLAEMTAKIGTLQGRLRYRHLVAHLESRDILTPDQLREYARLRGYAAGEHHHHH